MKDQIERKTQKVKTLRSNGVALVRQFLRDEDGQTTTEYILILAVVTMIAMKFKGKFQTIMGGAADTVNSNIETVLQSQ